MARKGLIMSNNDMEYDEDALFVGNTDVTDDNGQDGKD